MLHGFQDLLSGDLLPGGSDNSGYRIVLAEKGNDLVQFFLAHALGPGQNDAVGVLDLIVIELTEVLLIHLALFRICHGGKAVQNDILHMKVLDGTDDIGQLAHARRLDQDAVRMVLVKYLLQRFAEIAYQRTADAALAHFGDLDTGFLHETSVDADLTEFVFDQHQLLARICFFDQFFDQRSLSGTKKTGENIDFSHLLKNPPHCFFVYRDLLTYHTIIIYRLSIISVSSHNCKLKIL